MLQIHALKNLNKMIDYAWHEIADSLQRIEELAEDQQFPERALASSVASKVYYYLEEYDESLRLALESGDKFDLNDKSQYVEKLINECIDQYIKLKQELMDKKLPGADGQIPAAVPKEIDPKMEVVIDKMFKRCFNDNKYKHVIGIALESRRLDMVKAAIEQSGDQMEENLGYTFNLAQQIVNKKEFRTEVLRLLLLIYQNRNDSGNFDYYKIAKCQFYLQKPEGTASLLEKLVKSEESYLDAYQIAFDICDKEVQAFQSKVVECLNAKLPQYQEEAETLQRIQ